MGGPVGERGSVYRDAAKASSQLLQTTHGPSVPAPSEFRSAGGVRKWLRVWLVTGREGGHWGSHVVLLFFCPLSLPLLARRTMPMRTINTLCSDKRIIIKGDEVVGSKQQEDSIVIGCTLTDSQRAIRCCVCSCHRSLITLRNQRLSGISLKLKRERTGWNERRT